MAIQSITFQCGARTPDYNLLKWKLGNLRGVTEMNINSQTKDVAVDFDDGYLTQDQLTRSMGELGYRLS